MNKFFSALVFTTICNIAIAQQSVAPVLTAAQYAKAEQSMGYNTAQLVDRASVRPNWLSGDRFWYRVLTAQGSEYIIVDPAKGTKTAAFDQQKLAAALSAATGQQYTGAQLPFLTYTYSADEKSISFTANKKNWTCDLTTNTCTAAAAAEEIKSRRADAQSVSPDGKRAVFIRDYNLWMKDLSTNTETQLTTDGIKDFGYATDNAGWRKSDNPIVVWSADSKKIATYQQDQRNVSDMYLVTTNVGKP
ncbi:MAG: DPP IV N-terminal domain-containing protein, partial [Ferruginibacter sp.]